MKHLPNIITSLNLFCGCIGIVMAFSNQLSWAVYLIWLAMLFDFMDGFVARLLKVSSDIGKQLDSLADMVTFGLLPAIILFQLFPEKNGIIEFVSFGIAIFSALRLAKFNIDDSQSDSFVGVPTPANALFISSMVFLLPAIPFLNSIIFFIIISLISSFWLVMPFRLLALKFKDYQWKNNVYRYLLVILSVALLIIFKTISLPFIIILYLLLSIINNVATNRNTTNHT